MKFGLICKDEYRKLIESKLEEIGVTVYDNADLYLVGDNFDPPFLPCILFDTSDLDKLISIVAKQLPSVQTNKFIGYKDDTYHMLDIEKILYFEAASSNVKCITKQSNYQLKDKLYVVESRLPKENFIRISRSFIINIDQVATIAPWFNRRLLITFIDSNISVEVSKNYVNDFKKFIGMR